MRVLHHHWLNSGSRFCRLLLAEKKLDALQKLENWWQPESAFLTINPAGHLPVMVEDDGTHLIGVWAVAEYLEEAAPDISLHGATPKSRAEARRLMDLFCNKMEREVVMPLLREKFLARMMADAAPSSEMIRAAHGNLQWYMKYIDHLADTRKWLAGSKISGADLYAAASLSVVDYLGSVNWDDFPEARMWYVLMKSRPSFRALLSDRVEGLVPPPHYDNLDF